MRFYRTYFETQNEAIWRASPGFINVLAAPGTVH